MATRIKTATVPVLRTEYLRLTNQGMNCMHFEVELALRWALLLKIPYPAHHLHE